VKVICKQQDLAKGLSTVSHAVSSRTTLPILSNILVVTEEGRIRLTATNLEIGITCWVPAEVQEEGTTTVPAKLFTEFVSSLPSTDVTMALQEGTQTLRVSGGRTVSNIRGMDPAEFPTLPSADDSQPPVLLDAAELRSMIQHVAFAAATDDTRRVFTGVLARFANGRLTFAAADSFRLAVREADLPESAASSAAGDVLIPARTLSELARVLPPEGTVQMIVTPQRNQVVFHVEGVVDVVSNLLADQFPNYSAIVPKTHATTANVDTAALREATKRASLFARDSNNIVRLKVEPGDADSGGTGRLTLSATADELGDATDTVEAAVDGAGLEIIFNVKYLSDVLAVIDTPSILLEFNQPQQPGVVKPGSDVAYTYVVMPMHNTR
jgi:DNA polymerase III subunit beta